MSELGIFVILIPGPGVNNLTILGEYFVVMLSFQCIPCVFHSHIRLSCMCLFPSRHHVLYGQAEARVGFFDSAKT